MHAQAALRSADVTPAISGAHLPSLAGAMHQTAGIGAEKRARPARVVPLLDGPGTVRHTALQSSPGSAAPVTPGLGFDGIGIGIGVGIGAGRGSYVTRYAPPDTTGPVCAAQYVQWVHADIAAFGKATGALAPGFPKASNALFAGLGGPCETSNDGDPMVQYDKAANCWILSQFAVPGGTAGYWQCVAVSAAADATGGYYRYAFPYTQFNDYPKLGVWTDGYYTTFNMFTSTFQGAKMCAYDRARMLAGLSATQQCFQLSTSYGGVLPADLDGATAPPAGAPNYLVAKRSTSLAFWKFHVDWANPANTVLSAPAQIPIAASNAAAAAPASRRAARRSSSIHWLTG